MQSPHFKMQGKILVTGATGFIGRRLAHSLINDGVKGLRVFVRNAKKLDPELKEKVEIVEGNTLDVQNLLNAFEGVEVAYYLIHSMGKTKDYAELDRKSAQNFMECAIKKGVRRIIYLGGLGKKETASKHLKSRIETGEILSARPGEIQTIWFRAGVVIGAGSASFEIMRSLIEKLPIMITPKWVRTKTEPMGIDNIIEYLKKARELEYSKNLIVDLGIEKMSFQEMMLRACKVMKLRRLILPVPLLTPRLSSYWLVLFTPVPYKIARELILGLSSETIRQNNNAAKYFPEIKVSTYKEAVSKALSDTVNRLIVSRWCDSTGGKTCDLATDSALEKAVFRDIRTFPLKGCSGRQVFKVLKKIGGENGWLSHNIFWKIRGIVDKILGGYGLSRGRRDPEDLRIGDAVDFWKVIDLIPSKRLLLLSQMRLPGKAWLEFSLTDEYLTQTAHFIPKGLLGRLYWYGLKPFHNLVFSNLGMKIINKARDLD